MLTGMTDETANVSSAIDNAHTVEVFLAALENADIDGAGAFLDDNLVYQNVGYPTIRGRARTMKLFRSLQGKGRFEAKTHRIAVNGATVLTERTDALIIGPVRVQFWVCGVFEVCDGRITLWRDYFDIFDFAKAIVRGIVGAIVSPLKPNR